jgi:D-alanine-D-alanine ligase
MNNKTVVIAFGGVSPEHEVSVLTAMQAISALSESSYKTVPLYISKSGLWYTGDYLLKLEHYENLDQVVKNSIPCSISHDERGQAVLKEMKTGLLKKKVTYPVDVMFISFHGGDGENGSFQGLCEVFNIPYTGSGVLASSAGMDKLTAKALCRANNVTVVDDVHFFESEWVEDSESLLKNIAGLGYPVVIKPVHLGSSIGVSIAEDHKKLNTAIELAFRYDEQILVEKAVKPLMEINCAVIGTPDKCRASVCERPLGKEELLSFTDKYMGDSNTVEAKGMASASREIPADISGELSEKIQNTSKKVFKILKSSGVARLDFLVNPDTWEFYFNEINTIPGSFSFYLWEESDLSFSKLLIEMIDQALERQRKKNGRVQSYDTNLLSQKAVKGLKGLKGTKRDS